MQAGIAAHEKSSSNYGFMVVACRKTVKSALSADLYVGNRLKAELTNIVANMIKGRIKAFNLKTDVLHDERWIPRGHQKLASYKIFVKVQDGCDSFVLIIVPLRGRPISRDMRGYR